MNKFFVTLARTLKNKELAWRQQTFVFVLVSDKFTGRKVLKHCTLFCSVGSILPTLNALYSYSIPKQRCRIKVRTASHDFTISFITTDHR